MKKAFVFLAALIAAGVAYAEPPSPAELLPEILNRPFVDEGTPARIAEADAPSMVVPLLAATLTVLWMLGIVLGLCRLASAFAKQRRVIVGQPWRPDFWTDELTSNLAGKLGLRKFPAVYLSRQPECRPTNRSDPPLV